MSIVLAALRSRAGAAVAAAGLATMSSGLVVMSASSASADSEPMVWVCKFVAKPDVKSSAHQVFKSNVRPLGTDFTAVPPDVSQFPAPFADEQQNSLAVAWAGPGDPVLTDDNCQGEGNVVTGVDHSEGSPDCDSSTVELIETPWTRAWAQSPDGSWSLGPKVPGTSTVTGTRPATSTECPTEPQTVTAVLGALSWAATSCVNGSSVPGFVKEPDGSNVVYSIDGGDDWSVAYGEHEITATMTNGATAFAGATDGWLPAATGVARRSVSLGASDACAAGRTAVQPKEPRWHDPTCALPQPTFDFQSVKGVAYRSDDNTPSAEETVTVTASVLDGYVFAEGATTQWKHTFGSAPTGCEKTPSTPGTDDPKDDDTPPGGATDGGSTDDGSGGQTGDQGGRGHQGGKHRTPEILGVEAAAHKTGSGVSLGGVTTVVSSSKPVSGGVAVPTTVDAGLASYAQPTAGQHSRFPAGLQLTVGGALLLAGSLGLRRKPRRS